jgi:hypothetical protein
MIPHFQELLEMQIIILTYPFWKLTMLLLGIFHTFHRDSLTYLFSNDAADLHESKEVHDLVDAKTKQPIASPFADLADVVCLAGSTSLPGEFPSYFLCEYIWYFERKYHSFLYIKSSLKYLGYIRSKKRIRIRFKADSARPEILFCL